MISAAESRNLLRRQLDTNTNPFHAKAKPRNCVLDGIVLAELLDDKRVGCH
jgi:hypothetical protein